VSTIPQKVSYAVIRKKTKALTCKNSDKSGDVNSHTTLYAVILRMQTKHLAIWRSACVCVCSQGRKRCEIPQKPIRQEAAAKG